MSDSNLLMKKLERIYRTASINVITEVDDSVTSSIDIKNYLNEKKYSWLTVLNNGEILFYFDPGQNDKQARIDEINSVANLLRKRGIDPHPRPCVPAVIQYLLAQNTNKKTVKRSHQIGVVTDNTIEEQQARTELQHLLDNIIDAASQAGSSDIHIETDENNNTAVFRFRVDGLLTVQTASALRLTERTATRLGSMIIGHEAHTGGGSTSDTFDKNRPINGSFTITTETRTIKLRYSHLPTAEPKGLSIVMRIVTGDGKGSVPGFVELQYSPSEIALLERIFQFAHGIIFFTGPTGSGKSSAMAAGIKTIPDNYKVISVEDPVESKLPNVCQVQIGNTEHTSYAAYSRTLLRQDPDVIIYGEVRDPVVMQSAIDQANTGHLILSTLHSNTPADAIQRLIALGSELSTLAEGSLIRGIVGQRLVGKLCPHCKVKLTDAVSYPWSNKEHRRVINYFKDIPNVNPEKIYTRNISKTNCQHCKDLGEKGRLPLVEIIMLDHTGREYIKRNDISGWLRYLRTKGWEDLKSKAIQRIGSGEICPLTAERILESPFGINANEFDYQQFNTMTCSIELGLEATE